MRSLTRRGLLASLAAVPLAGCQSGENAKLRYRVIASFEVDGHLFEASTVMEIHYARVTNSLIGAGGATRLYGEALIADLDGRGTVYILPIQHPRNASLTQVYEYGVLSTLGIHSSVGSLTDADFSTLRNAKGRKPFRLHKTTRLPAFISFSDEQDPKTIFELQPSEVGQYVSGARFLSLDIEITDAPVTRKLRQRLPWLNSVNAAEIFPRDPRGARRPNSELPLSHMITRARFFGDGSR